MISEDIFQKSNQNDRDQTNTQPINDIQSNMQNFANLSNFNEEKIQSRSQHVISHFRDQQEDEQDENQTDQCSTKRQQELETIQEKLTVIKERLKIRKIIKYLLNFSRSRMLKNMSTLQYQFLNDKSQDFSDIKNRKIYYSFKQQNQKVPLVKFFKQVIKAIDKLPVINPASIFKKLWDTLIAIVLLYSFFIIPIMVSFGLDDNIVLLQYSFEVILISNVIDTLIQINTGFYEHGILQSNRKEIRKKYYSSQFSVDLFSILPLIIYRVLQQSLKIETQYYQFITLSIFIRWKSQIKVYKNLQQSYILKQKVRDFLSLLDLFLKVIFIAHICACIWILTARLSEFVHGNSWIYKSQLRYEPWETQYLNSFYFCTVTMSTVGYGDIVAVTSLEILVCILMMLFASGVFGFSITTINGILEQFFKHKNEILQKMFIIKNYLQKKSINQILQRDITEYLEYVWRQQQNNYIEEENNMIKLLPSYLKSQLYEESNKFLLLSPILQKNFSDDLLKAIIPIIQEKNFTPNEPIFQQNEDTLDQFLYFIQQGQAENFIQLEENEKNDHDMKKSNQKLLKIFNKGDYFGEIEFFTGQKSLTHVKSMGFTTVLLLSRSNFIQILKKFPQDLEQFSQIKDKIIFSHDYSKIFHNCYSCSSQKHTVAQCPFIHLTNNIYKIISLHNKADDQDKTSSNVEKIARSQFKCQLQSQDLFQVCQLFQEENEENIKEYEEKFLQFSINQCDLCSNIKEIQEKKNYFYQKEDPYPIQIQQSGSSLNFSQENINGGIHNSQNSNNIKRQFFNQKTYSKQISQNSDEQQLITKKKGLGQKLEIMDQDNKFPNNLLLKTQKSSNIESNNQAQKLNSSLKVVSLQNIGLISQQQTIEQEQHINQDVASSIYQTSQNNQGLNQNNLNLLQPTKVKSKLQAVSNPKLNKIQNMQNQHSQIQYFDIFQGAFEKLKCFDFYFPLSNYEIIIKQIHLNSDQKKKILQKALEKQKQKYTEIFNKKRRQISSINSFHRSLKNRNSIKLQDSQKNGRSSLFSQNNTIVISNNNSLQIQAPQSAFTIQKQRKSKTFFDSRTVNQSLDKSDETDTLQIKIQNQIQSQKRFIDSIIMGNDISNINNLNNQSNQSGYQKSNQVRQEHQKINISQLCVQSAKDQFYDFQSNLVYSPKSLLHQKKEDDYISSSPMIESQILKCNFSQLPCIDVSKYNNQLENQHF